MFMDYKSQCSKDVYFSQIVYRFNIIPIKILAKFFAEINKILLNFVQNCKGTWKAKTILEKIVEGIIKF